MELEGESITSQLCYIISRRNYTLTEILGSMNPGCYFYVCPITTAIGISLDFRRQFHLSITYN